MIRRRKPLRRRGKSNRAKIKLELDALHSKFIRTRDGNRCVQCGSTSQPTCGHVFSREHLAVRWDTRPDGNCHCQCWSCNSGHSWDSFKYLSWYIKRFGEERLNALHKEWTTTVHWGDGVLREMIEEMRKKVEAIQGATPWDG